MPDGFLRKEDLPDDSLVSDRTWLLTALCVVFGGWFGLHRLYLGRYGSGAFRLFLAGAAVYCGTEIPLDAGGIAWRMGLLAVFGAVFDLLMIVLGPILARRRHTPSFGLTPTMGLFPFPLRYVLSQLLPRGLLSSSHPVPNIDGTLFTLPVLTLLLVTGYFRAANMAQGVQAPILVFFCCSAFAGVYWGRDCLRVFYWGNLADAGGRLPL